MFLNISKYVLEHILSPSGIFIRHWHWIRTGSLMPPHIVSSTSATAMVLLQKDEQATAQAWRGGWFHTGDTVRQEKDGMLHFVDRKKNIIRRSGENIAAAEVEAVLQSHAMVKQVAVIPVPDEFREEEVFACVVLARTIDANDAADTLFDHCNAELAYFKTPGWIYFADSLPTTGTQKIQKHRLFPDGTDPRTLPGVFDRRDRKKRSSKIEGS